MVLLALFHLIVIVLTYFPKILLLGETLAACAFRLSLQSRNLRLQCRSEHCSKLTTESKNPNQLEEIDFVIDASIGKS